MGNAFKRKMQLAARPVCDHPPAAVKMLAGQKHDGAQAYKCGQCGQRLKRMQQRATVPQNPLAVDAEPFAAALDRAVAVQAGESA